MTLDPVLLDAIESSLFWTPDVPGLVENLHIPDVRGHVTGLSHPLVNLVGAATLTEDNANNTIQQVVDFFASQDKAFGWVIGPLTEPHDLGERLRLAGMTRIDEMAGMALTDMDRRIEVNPSVRVRPADHQELLDRPALLSEAYGLPKEVAELFVTAIARAGDALHSVPYLAFVEDRDEPVAWSYLTFMPGEPVVVLSGAATLPDYRGRGIYSAMVATRLKDARADGAQGAAIQAVRSTSAPICEKLGFREVGAMEFYAWIPADAGAGHA